MIQQSSRKMKVASALAMVLLAVSPVQGARSGKYGAPEKTNYKYSSKSLGFFFEGYKDLDDCSSLFISVEATNGLIKEGGTRNPTSLVNFHFDQNNCDGSSLRFPADPELSLQLTGSLKGVEFTIEGTGSGLACQYCEDPDEFNCPCEWLDGLRISLTGTLTPITSPPSLYRSGWKIIYPDGTRSYSKYLGSDVSAAVTLAGSVGDVLLPSDLEFDRFGPPSIRKATSGELTLYK
jgi:hypothetical protein